MEGVTSKNVCNNLVSVKAMQIALSSCLSPMLCALAGASYHHFNENYVVKWWVHCKHCVIDNPPTFDANDFTFIFFGSLCLLNNRSCFFVLKQRRWPFVLGMFVVNGFICLYFLRRNIWV